MAVHRWMSVYRCEALMLLFTSPVALRAARAAAEIPPDTRLSVRLTNSISSKHSQPGNLVSGLLIAPVRVNGEELLPAGFIVTGTVVEPTEAHKRLNHSVLCLDFGKLIGKSDSAVPFSAKVAAI